MKFIAARARPGLWVDTNQGRALTDTVLDRLVAFGAVGVFGYLPLPGNVADDDWTGDLLMRVCAKGLQASFVQHVRKGPGDDPLWRPADHDGGLDAQCAVAHLKAIVAPDGVHVAQDLEACSGSSADSAHYTLDWGNEAIALGMLHRLYVGFSTLLSPVDLYDLHTPTSYWSDAGHRDVAIRGVDTHQGKQVTLAGVTFDTNIVAPDLKGDLFVACEAH